MLNAVKTQIAQSNPQLTPEQVQQQAETYFTQMADVLVAPNSKLRCNRNRLPTPPPTSLAISADSFSFQLLENIMSTGLLTSASAPADLNNLSFSQMITRLMPNGTAPLFGLTSLLKDESASDIEHGYFSKTMTFPSLQLNGAIANGVNAAFVVDTVGDTVVGDMFLVASTQEVLLVDAVISGTNITVRRGVGTVAAAAIADDVILYHIGNAFEEGSVESTAVSIQAVRHSNNTQIFRNSGLLPRLLLPSRRSQVLVTLRKQARLRGLPCHGHRKGCSSVRSTWAPRMVSLSIPWKV